MKRSIFRDYLWMLASIIGATLAIPSHLAGNVYFYENEAFRGAVKKFDSGEYHIDEFSHLRHANDYSSNYCSVKIPNGYYVDFDYVGSGFEHSGVRTYGESEERIRRGFKKIRIRKKRYDHSNSRALLRPQPNGANATLTIYEGAEFGGDFRNFSVGEYYGGKHCSNYYGREISIKLRKGYVVWLYDKNGKILKKAFGNIYHYNKGFHRFTVRKALPNQSAQ